MVIAVNTRLLLKGKLEGIGWFSSETLKRMTINHPEHPYTKGLLRALPGVLEPGTQLHQIEIC